MRCKKFILILLVLWSQVGFGEMRESSSKAVDIDYGIGSTKAPIIFYEYGSLTCHICSNFYQSIVPKIQKDFPDIQIVVRLMSFDKLDMAAAQMILHSKDPHGLSLAFYKSQDQWMGAPDQMEALKKVALDFGMTPFEIEASLNDKSLGHTLLSRRLILKAKSAPLFRIGKSLLPGLPDYDKYLKPMLERVVKKAKEGHDVGDYDVLNEMAEEEKEKKKAS